MKIAIVKLSALGDIVHAMVVLQFIKHVFPQSSIDWLVEERFADILKHNPDIDTILPVNLKALKRNKLQLFSEISKVRKYARKHYDIVIDMQGLIKSAVVSRLLGKSVGFDKDSIREKAAALMYSSTFQVPYEKNVIWRNIDLVSLALGFTVEEEALRKKQSFLYFSENERNKTASFLKEGKRTVVYILGSSWESKVYPKEKFLEVIKGFEGNHLLVWGSDAEKERAEYIKQRSDATILPKLTLGELKALIASADLVIGGDSGPTHMAWALNRPSITLFGPTPSRRNTLQSEINRVLDCGKEIDPLDLNTKDLCIRNIDPERIVTLAKELLV